jgi:hypothetical protein
MDNLKQQDWQIKIENIINYLHEMQQEDGEFPTLRYFPIKLGDYVNETQYQDWYDFGKCPFAAANIAYHLRNIKLPQVEKIISKVCIFLLAGMENGVARYVPAYHQDIDFPTDIDDTCLALMVLKKNNIDVVANDKMIWGNVTPEHDFFTWFMPRRKHLWTPLNYFWLLKDAKKCREKTIAFNGDVKTIFQEYDDSSEPAVAANVLLYLGELPSTEKYISRLIDRIERNDVPLQYYSELLFVYLHIARLYESGVKSIGVLKNKIFNYIEDIQETNGCVSNTISTAIAAITLIYLGYIDSDVTKKAVEYIANDDMHEMGWVPMHYCNDRWEVFIDGGPELTAAFVLEAMYMYKQYFNNNI